MEPENPDAPHILLVSFPARGHLNPLLHLAKRLASCQGNHVTVCTCESHGKKMRTNASTNSGLADPVGEGFLRDYFNDGFDEGDECPRKDINTYMGQLRVIGRQNLTRLIKKTREDSRHPVCCVINAPFLGWVNDVADVKIPNALNWLQNCASLAAYYHYFRAIGEFPILCDNEPEIDVRLTGMPLLRHDEIPSFVHPSEGPYGFIRDALIEQVRALCRGEKFCILIDTFANLEKDLIAHLKRVSLEVDIKPVGPNNRANKSAALTLTTSEDAAKNNTDSFLEWLDNQPPASVVYISFGTISYLRQEQLNELNFGIVNSGLPFLWVLHGPEFGVREARATAPDRNLGRGRLIDWCSQDRVLAHPALNCFVTHCGWNSTMEAISSGVPNLTFPQWNDQVTAAMYIGDLYRTGIRASKGEADQKLDSRDEVLRCAAVTGDKAEALKANVGVWKEKAAAAIGVGGSSDKNLRAFIDQIRSDRIND
uniref:Glucosyltransferase 4 n=1 Tax=Crocus sativus TaxID=82528 RepID=A0A0A8K9C4_CROSA|nr:glucosyltransferase 4 [Crocus sativus]